MKDSKKKYSIGVIAGDGTGPEVVGEGVKVIKAAARQFGFSISFKKYDFGGQRYIDTGKLIDDSDVQDLKKHDAVFLGAIGHPDVKPGILEKNILLKLRFELDQYINLRPVKLFPGVETPIKGKGPEHIDYVVVRENTGGIYTGCGGTVMKGTKDEVATQETIYTRFQVERCLRYAFEFAKNRHTAKNPWKGLSKTSVEAGKTARLTLCGKTNVLTFVFGLWERAFNEVGAEYPTVERAYMHVDAACLYMVQCPEIFDVIVTDNMFGDIITDLAAATQGGLGVAAGGNLNPDGLSMFEPIGGTAPMWTGKNAINPIAAIGAGALMLKSIGEVKAGEAIEAAIALVTPKMKSQIANEMGFTTTEIGDEVVKELKKKAK